MGELSRTEIGGGEGETAPWPMYAPIACNPLSLLIGRSASHPCSVSSYLFSCENATYAVPAELARLFSGEDELLSSAEGWAPGALNLAQAFSMRFRTPLVDSETSKLLVNVEDSKDVCWSRFSESLDDFDKRKLLERYWQPYRKQLHKRILGDIERHGTVIHVMVHSCSNRREHIELHIPERAKVAHTLSLSWLEAIQRDGLRSAMHTGKLVTDLSCELADAYDPACYAQIRLIVHQDFFLMGTPWRWDTIKKHLLDSLAMSASRVATVAHD